MRHRHSLGLIVFFMAHFPSFDVRESERVVKMFRKEVKVPTAETLSILFLTDTTLEVKKVFYCVGRALMTAKRTRAGPFVVVSR